MADRWDPNGGVAWRARVIFETNMRTSYAAGRYKQMKGMAEYNPFWMYCHGDSMKPRPEHLELDRMVLRHDDPWWDKNYPPNDWGCQCYVRCLTEGEVKRGGYKVVSGSSLPDAATDPRWQHAHGKETALDLGLADEKPLKVTRSGDRGIAQSDLLKALDEETAKAKEEAKAKPTVSIGDGEKMPPEIAPSDLQQAIEEAKQEAARQAAAKAKEEAETNAAEQKMIDVAARAQEVLLKKLDADKAAKMRLALKAMAKASSSPFGLEEMLPNTLAKCYADVREGVEIPEPRDYTKIRFNRDFVKQCLASKMVSGADTYGFYIDPKTLKEIKIPSMARLEKLAVHELAHLIHWNHSEEHDKLVYDCMCELVPSYPNWHRVLDHRSGVYPWKSRPNQMGNLKWNLRRLLKKAKKPWQK